MELIEAWPRAAKIKLAGGKEGVAFDLQSALNRAMPGDVVELQPGTYHDPVVLSRSGKPGAPITIRVKDPAKTVLDGLQRPEQGRAGGLEPMDGDWAMLKIFRARHIVIEGLKFVNCWPQSIYLRGVSDLEVRDIAVTGSRYVVYARTTENFETEQLLLERISWVQDPHFDMWEGRATWHEVKGRDGHADKSWFNGGLFGSFDIRGDVVIRDCDLSHAFNGVRMDIRKSNVAGETTPEISRNRNVRITGCRFSFIRDNAVEPEMGAQGWLVADNLFSHVHATLSLDGVALRDFAFISNRLLNLKRPGGEGKPKSSGGKIIKFLDDDDYKKNKVEPQPAENFVTAFNSVRTRTRYLQDAALKPWTDRNNAVERLKSDDPRDDMNLFSEVVWLPGASVSGLATNGDGYPANDAHGTFDKMERVFTNTTDAPDPGEMLGGWNGDLVPAPEVSEAPCEKVSIYGPDGLSAKVDAGKGPGWKSLDDLGLSDWSEPGWPSGVPSV